MSKTNFNKPQGTQGVAPAEPVAPIEKPALGEVPLDSNAPLEPIIPSDQEAEKNEGEKNTPIEPIAPAEPVANDSEKAIVELNEELELDDKKEYAVRVVQKFGSYSVGDKLTKSGGVIKVLIKKNLVKLIEFVEKQ